MSKVIAFVLGGGQGTRLYPLTKYRAKPAVPLAGKYRLIDIPLSNCINSGIRQIHVLTQFMSVSLHRHIQHTYQFDRFSGDFVELLAAQQTMDEGDRSWYQGTADAVRKNIRYLKEPHIDLVLILSGDQLYRMDFQQMIEEHKRKAAEVSIAAIPVARQAASGLGIMRTDDEDRVLGFVEKPKTDAELAPVLLEPAWFKQRHLDRPGIDCLANMGIYLFNRDVLVHLLESTNYEDFGRQIFPEAIKTRVVKIHLFDGYWEDIGTIKAFYEANLDLVRHDPPFEISGSLPKVYTRARFLPPSRIHDATIKHSLIADGCEIGHGCVIENSIIGLRCMLGEHVAVRNSIIMGADDYQSTDEIGGDRAADRPPVGIGAGTVIEGAIIDKNCRIGRRVRIANEAGIEKSPDHDICMIRDGIPVVLKGATLADDWRL
jgi:glucose-1-phosphate adenylyltransferase